MTLLCRIMMVGYETSKTIWQFLAKTGRILTFIVYEYTHLYIFVSATMIPTWVSMGVEFNCP